LVKQTIDQYIAEGTTMVTDGYAMYAFLKNSKEFTHVVVDHKAGQYVNSGFHTNGIENFWSLLKRGIIGIYHQPFQHSQIKDHERFELSIRNSEGRLKYNQLIGE
jgi:hypothetical protein